MTGGEQSQQGRNSYRWSYKVSRRRSELESSYVDVVVTGVGEEIQEIMHPGVIVGVRGGGSASFC